MSSTSFLRLALALAPLGLLTPAAHAQFASGNIVVVRIGDGAAALSGSAQAVFLDEFTPTGTLVRSVPMPVAANGNHLPMTNSGTATSEGLLNVSGDGHYLVAGGYAAIPGTPSVAGTASASVGRVIARIDLNGTTDTTTAITNAFSAGNIRSVASSDGLQFWAAGSNSGIQYTTLGVGAAVALNTVAPTNNRVVNIYAGQLYTSTASGAFQGISTVGVGLPVTGGQTITILPGFPTATGPSSYDYFFADPNTLYVADDRANINGGIQKWTQSGGTWTLQYTLNPATNVGCRGLTGIVSGGVATLFATTTQTSANQIVSVVDSGAGSIFNPVATAGVNTVFRGLRLIPALGNIARNVTGCGPTTITTTGEPRIGGSVTTTLGNLAGAPLIGLGFTMLGLPFCGSCAIGHEWRFVVVGASTGAISIPNDPTLIGGQVGFQGVDVFGTGGCASPQVTLTDTMVVTIG